MDLIIQFRSSVAKRMNSGSPYDDSVLGKRKRDDRDEDPDGGDQNSDPYKRFARGCGILVRFFKN